MVGKHKSNLHIQLFLALWAYLTYARTTTSFIPFQLVYGLEAVLPIEWEIPSLKLGVKPIPNTFSKEERLLYMLCLYEHCQEAAMSNESNKKWVKSQYDRSIHPRVFSEGDLVLLYDQDHDKLGTRKFKPQWHGPYIIKCVLKKGAYELTDYEGNILAEPCNGLYLKIITYKLCTIY